jgi:hypothetical protein
MRSKCAIKLSKIDLKSRSYFWERRQIREESNFRILKKAD